MLHPQYLHPGTVSSLAQVQHLAAVQRPHLVESGLLRGDAMHSAVSPGQDVQDANGILQGLSS